LLMRDIYASATQVVVFLGHNAAKRRDDAEIMDGMAVDLMTDLVKERNNHGFNFDSLADKDRWKALLDLFQLSWFERLWTYQEIILASNSIIVTNYHAVPYSIFRNATGIVTEFSSHKYHEVWALSGSDSKVRIVNKEIYSSADGLERSIA